MIFFAGMLYYIVMCDVAGKVLLPTTGMGIVSFFFIHSFFFPFFATGETFFSFLSGYPGPSCIRFVSLRFACLHVCMYACARVCILNIIFGLLYARCWIPVFYSALAKVLV